MDICAICGRPAECTHHLIFGIGKRKLADEDGLMIALCNDCHNMAADKGERIHGNSMACDLSRMLGQAIWERDYLADLSDEPLTNIEYARDAFRQRYGKSWL